MLKKSEMADNLSLYERKKPERPVHILSVPLELGSDERGLSKSPEYLMNNGLQRMLEGIGARIAASDTIACPTARPVSAGNAKHLQEIAAVGRAVARECAASARSGNFLLALGGDHSSAIGTIAGAAAAHESLGVIYIDAHPDCNTDETTISGNVHGMVVTSLMGHGNKALTGLVPRKLLPQQLLYLGIKDFDQAEIDFVRSEGIHTVTMHDITVRGLQSAIDGINALRQKTRRIWVSMDMDSIDETYAPGVGMPSRDGFTRAQILALAQYIGKNCDVVGMDMVEIAPNKDATGATAQLALELIARLLGSEHTWYAEYMDSYKQTNVTTSVKKTAQKTARRSAARSR